MPVYVDHVKDQNGVEMRRLFEQYQDVIPNFVKQANFSNCMSEHRRPATVYADQSRSLFPCDNAASTFLSYMYYFDKRADYESKEQQRIESRLTHYAKYWGIGGAINTFLDHHNEVVKQADDRLDDSNYGYVWVDEDGAKNRLFRLTTTMEVKEAADAVFRLVDQMPFSDRHTAATRILSKAAALGAKIPDDQLEFLERSAGRGIADLDRVIGMLNNRAKLAKDESLRESMKKMATTLQGAPEFCRDPATMIKVAETVYMFDSSISLRPDTYSPAVPRPEDVLFEVTFSKTAKELSSRVATTSGTVYTKEALARVKIADIQSLFGEDIANEVKSTSGTVDPEKMATVLPTLPRPDAEMFDKLMSSNKLPPDMRKAASSKVGFTKDQLRSLASQF